MVTELSVTITPSKSDHARSPRSYLESSPCQRRVKRALQSDGSSPSPKKVRYAIAPNPDDDTLGEYLQRQTLFARDAQAGQRLHLVYPSPTLHSLKTELRETKRISEEVLVEMANVKGLLQDEREHRELERLQREMDREKERQAREEERLQQKRDREEELLQRKRDREDERRHWKQELSQVRLELDEAEQKRQIDRQQMDKERQIDRQQMHEQRQMLKELYDRSEANLQRWKQFDDERFAMFQANTVIDFLKKARSRLPKAVKRLEKAASRSSETSTSSDHGHHTTDLTRFGSCLRKEDLAQINVPETYLLLFQDISELLERRNSYAHLSAVRFAKFLLHPDRRDTHAFHYWGRLFPFIYDGTVEEVAKREDSCLAWQAPV